MTPYIYISSVAICGASLLFSATDTCCFPWLFSIRTNSWDSFHKAIRRLMIRSGEVMQLTNCAIHHGDIIICTMASQITSLALVYSTVCVRSKKTSKLRVTGLCAGNSPMTGEFPAQMASNAENVSIWWRHHDHLISLSITSNGSRQHHCRDPCQIAGRSYNYKLASRDSDILW